MSNLQREGLDYLVEACKTLDEACAVASGTVEGFTREEFFAAMINVERGRRMA